MLLSALRNYLELASGLTEVTRQRAVSTAKGLLSSSGAELVVPGAIGQVGALADEIMATSRANRELLVGMVRAEVDRTVTRLGLATHDEVVSLQRSVDRLTARLEQDGGHAATTAATKPAKRPATKPATKRSATKRPATKRPATKRPEATRPATTPAASEPVAPEPAVSEDAS